MKVIFLDVDGVLNCWGTRERILGLVGIENRLVKRLARIVAFTPEEGVIVTGKIVGFGSHTAKYPKIN